jgi:hypothetical protein
MERRDFIKLASMAGLGVVVAGPLTGRSWAAGEYTGRLWILIHAGGGWDPTSFCDPKGTTNLMDPDRMNNYLTSDIGTAGNIKFAPLGTAPTFFQTYANQLLIVNGIDTGTNSHDAGTRTTWTGTLLENKPSFAALVAGVYGPTLPMGFLSSGGYEGTGGVVPITRVPDPNVLERIAFPNVVNPGDTTLYHTDETVQRIATTREARHMARLGKQNLPRIKHAMNTLYASRLGQNELKQLIQYLPAQLSGESLVRQAQIAIAAYRAGICVSANLSIGGFDTHGQHDQNHIPRLDDIYSGIAGILSEATIAGILDKVVIIVGSDFGRTPGYNDGDGKDHWNVTSMMMLGAGVPGNKVFGATDERHNWLYVDPQTGQESAGGIQLKPGHIHQALRQFAQIDNSDLVQKFPLAEDNIINLFG